MLKDIFLTAIFILSLSFPFSLAAHVSVENNTKVIVVSNVSGGITVIGGNLSSLGSTGYIAKFKNSTVLNNSAIFQLGTNVGIGTATPESQFHLNGSSSQTLKIGTASTSRAQIFFTDQVMNYSIGLDTDDAFKISPYTYIHGSLGISLTTAGYLGVNTANPYGRVHIAGTGTSDLVINPVSNARTDIYTTNQDPIYLGTNNNSAQMILNWNGNVGIGTVNPSYTFDANGTGRFQSTLYASGGLNAGYTESTSVQGDPSVAMSNMWVPRTSDINNFVFLDFMDEFANLDLKGGTVTYSNPPNSTAGSLFNSDSTGYAYWAPGYTVYPLQINITPASVITAKSNGYYKVGITFRSSGDANPDHITIYLGDTLVYDSDVSIPASYSFWLSPKLLAPAAASYQVYNATIIMNRTNATVGVAFRIQRIELYHATSEFDPYHISTSGDSFYGALLGYNYSTLRMKLNPAADSYVYGNFGINTASPKMPLHVVGDANITGTIYYGALAGMSPQALLPDSTGHTEICLVATDGTVVLQTVQLVNRTYQDVYVPNAPECLNKEILESKNEIPVPTLGIVRDIYTYRKPFTGAVRIVEINRTVTPDPIPAPIPGDEIIKIK